MKEARLEELTVRKDRSEVRMNVWNERRKGSCVFERNKI